MADRVVVGIDGSNQSLGVLRWAVREANGNLRVWRVVTPNLTTRCPTGTASVDPQNSLVPRRPR